MRICKYCGAEIPADARFCGICGRVPVDPQATVSYPSPDEPAQPSNAPYPVKYSNRKPYQYTPLPPEPQRRLQPQPDWPVAEPPKAYNQQGSARPASWQQGPPPVQPYATPNASPYPAQPPLVIGSANSNQQGKAPGRPRRKGCMIGCLSVVVLLVVLGTLVVVTSQKVLAFGSAISTQSPLSSQTDYMNTSDRVNILLMGYGGAGHDGAYLTDSLVVMSLIPSSHRTTLLSVPRDLWVQYPPNSGNYTKINAIYTLASNGNANPVAGGNAIAQKVSLVTGLNIQYWMSINFTGFRKFIDSIGGVNVNVPDAFTANYPKNDDPSVNASWITVHFAKGMQHMDGATAIVYARARYVLDNPAEGSDFARSRRQQLIMQAALSRLKDWHTWPSMYSALDALKGTLYSNLSLADLASFALKMDLTNAHKLGLTNDNVLVDTVSSDGQAILLPRNNDWQAIIDYVKQGLYN
ncbi:MAG TPA: LCP family protein [Ktedonobacteraceae bacterium]|nr:LCP family protein [Ktedonobacteraceae bacterium]